MSVKGQLQTSRDVLMTGMRAAERAGNAHGVKVVRACLDLVEHLIAAHEKITVAEVEMTVGVLTQAASEVGGATTLGNIIRNAIGRLQTLRAEIATR